MFTDKEIAVVDRLLTTTRTVRRRLDVTRPVDVATVKECLRLATYAPSGSNLQTWRWIVVTDPEVRAQIGEYYRAAFETDRGAETFATYRTANADAFAGSDPQATARMMLSVSALNDRISEVPVLVVACSTTTLEDSASPFLRSTVLGSVFPAMWSFQLALRSRELASAFTTAHLVYEREVGQLLGIPEGVTQVGMIAVAHFVGDYFQAPTRRPIEEITYSNRWSDVATTQGL